MRLVTGFLFGVLALCAAVSADALAASSAGKAPGLIIRVDGGGWGQTRNDEIETLLRAVAEQLVPNSGARALPAIVVTHRNGHPMTRFEKGPRGEYLVELSAGDRRWGQFAYQFGHELCHILSNFEVHADDRKQNQWFEEALCETAALYTLRSLAATWTLDAPYADWRAYAPTLRSYANRFIAEPHRRLPDGTTLAAWLAGVSGELRDDPYQREKNEVVANRLLPLFEADPRRWAALPYLNLDVADSSSTFPRYLRHWYRNAPAEHEPFLREVLTLLGVDIVTEKTVARSPSPVPSAQTRAQAGPAGSAE